MLKIILTRVKGENMIGNGLEIYLKWRVKQVNFKF